MRVAFGWKVHSGWAALVALGGSGDDLVVVDRTRLELATQEWAKRPYHAAEDLERAEAEALVARGIELAHQTARRALEGAIARQRAEGNEVTCAALLSGEPMPSWSVEDVLSVHFRMHKAEGALFRSALLAAANALGLRSVSIPEAKLKDVAETALGASEKQLAKTIAALGRRVGAPWGKDEKAATLAALVALAQQRQQEQERALAV